jgi:Fe-Mn family superoxide dismutase
MHYSKHYLTYTNNLNEAIAGTEYENQSIEDILSKVDPKDMS